MTVPQSVPTHLIGDLLRILLCDFGCYGVQVARHPSLVLYAYDVTTGVVVDISADRLTIVPMIDGTRIAFPQAHVNPANDTHLRLCRGKRCLLASAWRYKLGRLTAVQTSRKDHKQLLLHVSRGEGYSSTHRGTGTVTTTLKVQLYLVNKVEFFVTQCSRAAMLPSIMMPKPSGTSRNPMRLM